MKTGGESAARLEAIDQFRGFSILLMVIANYAGGAGKLPSWLKHSPGPGLTLVDLIAPFFIFAIGLTFGLSARRRLERSGMGEMLLHFAKRYGILMAAGLLVSSGEMIVTGDPGRYWGVLQAIAAAAVLSLPFLVLPPVPRAGAGLLLLGLYHILLDRFWIEDVLAASHGGWQGALSWGAMLVLATSLADLYHSSTGRQPGISGLYLTSSIGLLLLGAAAALVVPVNKENVSASYVLISLSVGGLLFAVFDYAGAIFSLKAGLLDIFGRNPLLLYFIHYLLLGFFVLPGRPAWYSEAPVPLAAAQLVLLLSALGWTALILNRKGWVYSL